MAGIDKAQALRIAERKVVELHSSHELVIVEERTVERAFGWVFSVTTRRYLQTRNPGDLVPGIGPLVVERDQGAAEFLPTSVHPDRAIATYEQRWQERRKKN